jgi:hypothetical protein
MMFRREAKPEDSRNQDMGNLHNGMGFYGIRDIGEVRERGTPISAGFQDDSEGKQ